MKIPHDTDIYELMTTPGAEVTVVAKGKTREVQIVSHIPNTIDPFYEVDYPLAYPNKS